VWLVDDDCSARSGAARAGQQKKAAEAAPAPPSAHAESMAKKAKPAKTGAVSTPLSALSAGPAKRSLAEEKAELEAKIKKYNDKKKKADERLREIEAIIHAEETKKSKEYAKKRDEEEASERALKIDPLLNPIIERLKAIPPNTPIYSLYSDVNQLRNDALSLDDSRHEDKRDKFRDAWDHAKGSLHAKGITKTQKEALIKVLKQWRAILSD
jgi:hypothetical protein